MSSTVFPAIAIPASSMNIAIKVPAKARRGGTKKDAKIVPTNIPAIVPSRFFLLFISATAVLPKLLPTKCETGSANVRINIAAIAMFLSNSCNVKRG